MSRRGRAVGFASAAAVCAGLAAGARATPGGGLSERAGELREVLVSVRPLTARRPLRAGRARETLAVRRVPEAFVPPDALAAPEQALGRRPAVTVPAGSYVVASQFSTRAPEAHRRTPPVEPGRRPVEIAVSGAGTLAADGTPARRRVDVVVTTEPGPGGGPGRTYVAAAAVQLLELRAAAGDDAELDAVPGPVSDSWVATLALTKAEALRLIQAESFARAVRLIGR